MKNFRQNFGEETLVSNIRYYDLEKYRNHLRGKPVHGDRRRADGSINREMTALGHVFSRGAAWELLEQSPFASGPSLRLKENNQRLRFLNEDEIKSLLDACQPYLSDIVTCAINTGMKKGEILSLKWEQIRNGFIYLTKTKTKESRQIPINDDLDSLFKRIRRKQQLRSSYVFTKNGKHIKDVREAFLGALRRAGIVGFRFHDLRHTFASQLIMKGGTIKDVQELFGHKSMAMPMRYAHLSQEHKRNAVNFLNGLTGNNMAQTWHKPDFSQNRGIPQSI